MDAELINWQEYDLARRELGDSFLRILGYFREDGVRSVDAIEEAMRLREAAGLVLPAHTLKSEARQFGAIRLGDMAEQIEMTARHCVENHQGPEELLELVMDLRDSFNRTLSQLEVQATPSVVRKPVGFGRNVRSG